jgi:hypothetical protein
VTRFRLSSLMLLVVIAGLTALYIVQVRTAFHREAELRARLAASEMEISRLWWNMPVQGLEGKFDSWSTQMKR